MNAARGTYSQLGIAPIAGEYVLYASGPRDDWDWGLVRIIGDNGSACVAWRSGTVTVVPRAMLVECAPYPTRSTAERAWVNACDAADDAAGVP